MKAVIVKSALIMYRLEGMHAGKLRDEPTCFDLSNLVVYNNGHRNEEMRTEVLRNGRYSIYRNLAAITCPV